jgi:hypothetical protein
LGFDLAEEEVLTPAALAVAHCRRRAYGRVSLMVGDSLREDLEELEAAAEDEPADAVILGDLESGLPASPTLPCEGHARYKDCPAPETMRKSGAGSMFSVIGSDKLDDVVDDKKETKWRLT